MLRAMNAAADDRTQAEETTGVDPIETLSAEHRIIEQVLTAFDAWARAVTQRGTDERAELARFLRFFERFVDRCHHAKEEDIFFRALQRADPRTGPLVHVSFREQEEQRGLLEPLQELACRPRAARAADREVLTASVAAFVAAMRAHIDAEEHVLFPAARSCIPADEMARTAEAFAAFDDAENATGEHDRLRELGRSLIDAHTPSCTQIHRPAR